jgi:hypothetical protein
VFTQGFELILHAKKLNPQVEPWDERMPGTPVAR